MSSAKPDARWWARTSGHFHDSLERALASGVPGRVGLAWAIIVSAIGNRTDLTKRGVTRSVADAMNLDDNGYKELSGQLNGKRALRIELLDRVGAHLQTLGPEFAGWTHSNLIKDAHIFAIGRGTTPGFAEPGDEQWDIVHHALGFVDPDSPSAAELRSKYPQIFPEFY